MNPPTSDSAVPPRRRAWPWITVVAVITGGAVLLVREIVRAPVTLMEGGTGVIRESGRQLRSLAQSFRQGTVRTEFLSHATEVAGASRLQVATLKQNEVFKREETGAMAWGWVPLPRVVEQAQAPVEYIYSVDFAAPWLIERRGDTLLVLAPPIEPATPALDVSALTFYTLEGSLWRDESAVREKLRMSLTAALKARAIENEPLIREIGRKRIASFFEKWLAGHFTEGAGVTVKVIFPDEQPAQGEATPR